MGCMTHECIATLDNGKRCDFVVIDNTRRGQPCPHKDHGFDYMSHYCDEVADHNDSRDERDEQDEQEEDSDV
jgi:hypothetical protein